MIIDFKSIEHNFYGIVDQPVVTLKKPHGAVIATIMCHSMKAKLRYNDVSEIDFYIPAYDNGEKVPYYDEVLGDRHIEVESLGDFILVNPEVNNEGGIKETKTCKAYSLEYVFNFKRLNIPSGTYNFYNPADNQNTITAMILEKVPDWKIGHIDSDLIGRWRTFENTEDNLYSFMMNTLQESYNCLFIFDTVNKTINVKSATSSVSTLPIYLSYNNLLKTVKVTELSDEVITVVSGYGSGDEVDIRSVNPNGTNKIYNLDYYISRGDIPDDLADKWLAYRDMCDLYQDVFSNFNVLYNQKNAALIAGQAELIAAKTEYDSINTTYLTAQTNEKPDEEAIAKLAHELEAAKEKVDSCQRTIDKILTPDLDEIIKQRANIVKLCKLENNFSNEEVKILSQYFKEDSITEDTFVLTEYGAASSENISNTIDKNSNAKLKITGSQIYATNIAEIFNMDTNGFYKPIYTDPDTGEEIYFTSNIEAFDGVDMPSEIESIVVDQLNENLKRKMFEFRSGSFEFSFKTKVASNGVVNDVVQIVKGDIVNVDFSYNSDNLEPYVDETSPDTTKVKGFIICASLRNAELSGTKYPSMNVTIQGMMKKEIPQLGKDFLSFDIESAVFSCTGAITEYQKQNTIQELYNYTKDSLDKLAYPSYEFAVESGNFIFAEKFKPFKEKLELGCKINLMLDEEENELLQPILIELDINFDDASDFSIVFSDKYRSNNSEFKLADLITESTRTAHSVSLNKGSYNAYKDSSADDQIDNLTNGALDVAKNKIINSANQAVEWNSSGLFLRKYASNGGYEDKQVGLISDTIAFTKDNWKSVEIAIGAFDDPNTGSGYGIVAPSIFGTLLAGKNLVIDNLVYKDDGTTIAKQFRVDSTGAWLNNSSFVLSQDASGDFEGGKILIDPKYGIAAGNLDLFTLGDSEGKNGTEIHPSFIDENGKVIFDETKLIETPEGSIPYIPKNTKFFFNIRTGDAYFGGDINAENIIAGTLNGNTIIEGSIDAGSKLTGDVNSEQIYKNVLEAINKYVEFQTADGKPIVKMDSAVIGNLTAKNFKGEKIEADSIEAKNITGDLIEAINLNASEATIDNAKIGNLSADKITSGTLDASKATIKNIDADNINTGKLSSDYIDIKAGYIKDAMIDNLSAGKINTGTITSDFSNSIVSHIGTGQIQSAMIKELEFGKITGVDINTKNFTVHSDDGKSQWKDNTIQISDANRIRVQIGKDAEGDYNMYVWDASGKLMFDACGLTGDGIQREIIRNDMVATDANIDGSKLNIQSVVSYIDESTYTLSSSHLLYDGTSLDLFLGSMSETVTEQGNTLSSQGTKIETIQGQITSKVWQQDIDTAKGEMSTQYSSLEQSLNGFKTEVSNTYSTKLELGDVDKKAGDAQTTANNKRRVFVITPTPPYDIGDLWVQGETGDIMKCKIAKTEIQSYTDSDWEKASKYTDDTRADEAYTKAEQTADKFTWIVKSGTNSTDFTLTDRVASLLSSEFQIDALTTFKNSAIDGTSTVINGGAIKTGTIDADRLNVTDLKAVGATIGGFTIGDSAIYNGATSLAGADNSVYLGLDGISCGVSFKVDKAGNLSATSGKIAGFTIDNDKLSNAENPTSILDIGYVQEELKRWPGSMGNSYYLDYQGNMKVGIDNTGVGFYSLRRRGTPPVTISETRSDYNLNLTSGEKTDLVSSKVYAGLSGESVVFVIGANETMDSWTETWYSHAGFGSQYVEETGLGLTATDATMQAECNLNITGDVTAANLTRQKVTISGFPSSAGYTCYYYPVLKMCFLRLYYTGKAISATTTTVLGTVASGYRPSTQHALSIYPSQDTLKHRQAAISSDGGIKFYSEVAKASDDDTYISGFWYV